MVAEEIVVTVASGVGQIRIDRPAKKNALTTAMYAAMAEAMERFENDATVNAVVIRGGNDFTAGNDLQDFMMASMAGTSFEDLPVLRFLDRLRDCTKPVIAAVRGNAVGIGTTMLLHVDVAIAGESARFRLPFAQLGLVPEAGSSLLLPLTVGRARASALLMTGEFLSAEAAREIGLIAGVHPDEEVDAFADGLAAKLAAMPPEALRETKRLIRAPFADQVKAQMQMETEAFTKRLTSDEFRAAAMKLLSR
jgi:enoyl-CoA hydratase/carnithine racemase